MRPQNAAPLTRGLNLKCKRILIFQLRVDFVLIFRQNHRTIRPYFQTKPPYDSSLLFRRNRRVRRFEPFATENVPKHPDQTRCVQQVWETVPIHAALPVWKERKPLFAHAAPRSSALRSVLNHLRSNWSTIRKPLLTANVSLYSQWVGHIPNMWMLYGSFKKDRKILNQISHPPKCLV